MTKLAVTYPDAERLVVDYLAPLLAPTLVRTNVPADWTPATTLLRVVSDGVPSLQHPVLANYTIRMVAMSGSPTTSKELAAKALGLLSAHTGDGQIASTAPFTGPLTSRDPSTGAELASVTARVTVRSTPIT